jgi:hypothetical protein
LTEGRAATVALGLITVTVDADARVTPRGWLTLNEAADALGVSVHSVRRRARAGQLVARQVPTDRGPAWRVLLHPDAQGGHGDARDDHRDAHPDATVGAQATSDDVADVVTVNGHPDATVKGQGGTLITAELVGLLREREARIDELTSELVVRTEAATMWQERAGMLADRLATAETKLLALEAPKSPLDASTRARSAEPTAAGTSFARFRPLIPWVLAVLALVVLMALLALR